MPREVGIPFQTCHVVQEASAGNPEAARARLDVLEMIELLAVTEEALRLAQTLLETGPLPKKAAEDALHVAIAVTNGIQFLLTWNCKHLANATTRPVVEHICRTQGYEPVIICTPEELLEE